MIIECGRGSSPFRGVPVIAIDPPGFGHSPVPVNSPSLEIYADYVAQAVRAEGAEKYWSVVILWGDIPRKP